MYGNNKAAVMMYNGNPQPQAIPLVISGNTGFPRNMQGTINGRAAGANLPSVVKPQAQYTRRYPIPPTTGSVRGPIRQVPRATGRYGVNLNGTYNNHNMGLSQFGSRGALISEKQHMIDMSGARFRAPVPPADTYMLVNNAYQVPGVVTSPMKNGCQQLQHIGSGNSGNLPVLQKRGTDPKTFTSSFSPFSPSNNNNNGCTTPASVVSAASSWRMSCRSPTAAVLQNLTPYEEEEVTTYLPEVYYTGKECRNKIQAVRGKPSNDGFDDENNHYRVLQGDHIAYRYEILKELGRGTFGIVVSALDHKTNTQVAIKVIKNKASYTKQAKEEVQILEDLQSRDPDDCANIVRLLSTIVFRNHYVIVFELLSVDLYNMCYNNKFRPMPMEFIYDFCEQMLLALAFVGELGIIHCDLKPENIVVCHETSRSSPGTKLKRLKLIDFGSACRRDAKVYTYIQSRYYRAPEIVLGIPYTSAIDMWSFGCVLCELANGYPIFPGSSEGELLERMSEVLGHVPDEVLACGKRVDKFYYDDYSMRPSLGTKGRVRQKPGSRSLQDFLKSASGDRDGLFFDLVQQCLTYDPERRLTPAEALEHPFLKKWRKLRGTS